MKVSDLFSHPDKPEPESGTDDRRSEPVEFPVFSHADRPDSAHKASPS